MSLKSITHTLLERREKKSPLIAGIDGLGGSGKTSFAKKLFRYLRMQQFDVNIIYMDDYIVERNKRYGTGNPEWYEYYYLQWDIKMLRNNLFQKINNKCTEISLPSYDKMNDSISAKNIKVNPQSIWLIEGIFLQRKEWRKYLDFVIYFDCSFEIRKKRVLNRDLYIGNYQERLSKYQRRYWLSEEHYLQEETPKEKADLIINNCTL